MTRAAVRSAVTAGLEALANMLLCAAAVAGGLSLGVALTGFAS